MTIHPRPLLQNPIPRELQKLQQPENEAVNVLQKPQKPLFAVIAVTSGGPFQ
jgi:hypothetical protein